MIDKLNTAERRERILEFLTLHKQTTRKELSENFGVCVNTIVNDLYAINRFAPIYIIKPLKLYFRTVPQEQKESLTLQPII